MTILDLDTFDSQEPIACDVCIVGAGAAGITIAREFLDTKYLVILLEAGGLQKELESQTMYCSDVTGRPHAGIHEGRARQFGGTTTLWAGQALPLLDIDFEQRDWIENSGWPFGLETLSPYYRRAESVMQIDHVDYGPTCWPKQALPPYDRSKIASHFSQFASVPDFAKKYARDLELADNIRVLYHANVISLEATKAGNAITETRVRSHHGHSATIQSRFFVLCGGGIETARILLLSDSVERNGIGNSNDVVGRYFQDHPVFSLPIQQANTGLIDLWCNSIFRKRTRYSIKLVGSPQIQRQERILNVGAEVYYPTDAEDPLQAAKDLVSSFRSRTFSTDDFRSLKRVVSNSGYVTKAAWRYFVQNRPPSVGGGPPHLGFHVEQQPNPDSRVTLARDTDSLGLRRCSLHWLVTPFEASSVAAFGRIVHEEWRRLGVGTFDIETLSSCEHLLDSKSGFWDNNHHIGSTRMGSDVTTSVVNARCAVHGYDNLYIGSSSVFPTGGFSNPTLTVIALCLRIGDELKQRLSTEPRVAAL
jgi:choline dehydrogenase-like flavoprotein